MGITHHCSLLLSPFQHRFITIFPLPLLFLPMPPPPLTLQSFSVLSVPLAAALDGALLTSAGKTTDVQQDLCFRFQLMLRSEIQETHDLPQTEAAHLMTSSFICEDLVGIS